MKRVIHFEIQALDPARAVKFYTTVFGWEIKKWDGPMDYWLIMTGDKTVPGIDGGLFLRQGAAPSGDVLTNGFVCTVDVAALDEALTTITAAGGQIVTPKYLVKGVGWMASVKDTEGNIFGVMQEDRQAV